MIMEYDCGEMMYAKVFLIEDRKRLTEGSD